MRKSNLLPGLALVTLGGCHAELQPGNVLTPATPSLICHAQVACLGSNDMGIAVQRHFERGTERYDINCSAIPGTAPSTHSITCPVGTLGQTKMFDQRGLRPIDWQMVHDQAGALLGIGLEPGGYGTLQPGNWVKIVIDCTPATAG